MMLDYVTPSLDTTILAITNTIALFAEHPDQWELLRADRSLIPHAINESCVWSAQSAVQPGPHRGPRDRRGAAAAGSRVALLYGSANRDERHYPDPTRFDITRRPRTIWPSDGASTSASACTWLAWNDGAARTVGRPRHPVRHRRLHPNDQQRPARPGTPRSHRAHRRGSVTDSHKDGGWDGAPRGTRRGSAPCSAISERS